MEPWFLRDERRFFEERKALDELEIRSQEWLRGVVWKLGSGGLNVEVDIVAHGVTYEAHVNFPDQYPAVVPTIAPRDRKARWSDHQYGSGTLCTEIGQDNWSPDTMTAANLIESAFRLLDTENPHGPGLQQEVLSRHKTSIGQDLRTKTWRFLATPELQNYAFDLADSMATGKTVILNTSQSGTLVSRVWKIEVAGREPWIDPTFPKALEEEGFTREGLVRSVNVTEQELKSITNVATLAQLISTKGPADAPDFLEEVASCTGAFPTVLILCSSGHFHLYVLGGKTGEDDLFECGTLFDDSLQSNAGRRLPPEVKELESKRVGIVGVGSIGSTTAISLARYGVRDFVLVDDDVLLGANLVRHHLDWCSVGMHKVDALAHQLNLIAPEMKIDARTVTIAGQESTTVSASAYKALAACDLIIDASGDDETFGLLAYLSGQEKLSMAWAQVFSGGIGGLVARHRPDNDPTPFRMRDAFLAWAKEHETDDIPELTQAIPYGTMSGGDIHVAGNGEVGAVSSHLVLLALDTLLRRVPSNYPYSIYILGLRREWVFDGPFHTIPLRTDHLPFETPNKQTTEEMRAQNREFLQKLLQEKSSEDPDTP